MMCFIFHKRVMGSGQSNTCATCEVMLAEAENNTRIKQNEITKMGAQIKELNSKLKNTQDELTKTKQEQQKTGSNTKEINTDLTAANKRIFDITKDLEYNLFGFASYVRKPFKIYFRACNHKYHVYHDSLFLYLTDDESITNNSDVFTIDALGHLIPLDKPDKCIIPMTYGNHSGNRLMLYDLKKEYELDDEANSDKAVRTNIEEFDLPAQEHGITVNDKASLDKYIKEVETHKQSREIRNKGFSWSKWSYGGGFITLRFYGRENSAIGLYYPEKEPKTNEEIEQHIIKTSGILTLNEIPRFMQKAPNCFRFDIVDLDDLAPLKKESFSEKQQSSVVMLIVLIIALVVVMYYVYRQCFKMPVIGFDGFDND